MSNPLAEKEAYQQGMLDAIHERNIDLNEAVNESQSVNLFIERYVSIYAHGYRDGEFKRRQEALKQATKGRISQNLDHEWDLE